jgi:hypothetical protein
MRVAPSDRTRTERMTMRVAPGGIPGGPRVRRGAVAREHGDSPSDRTRTIEVT